MKVGGSTFAGVARRIATRHGLQHAMDGPKWLTKAIELKEPCNIPAVWGNHGLRMEMEDALQTRMPNAFMVSLIRDPVARAMSVFYQDHVGRKGVEPSDENKLKHLRHASPSWLSDYLARGREDTSEAILASYDFVGVTERFDESLLLLGRMLNVSMFDMLYLPAKVAGAGTRVPHPPITSESTEVQNAADHLRHGPDFTLLTLAHAALDEHRNAYGPGFKEDLSRFQNMLARVHEVCVGQEEPCLWSDNGCGQQCIDDLIAVEFLPGLV
mmetsp:Transcript_96042/g.271557  ORF Transcript_96042/g.271557 Transcript_96042/m.271557 type:complete len:270 (-) Transcript_96042:20-829(-)